MRCGLPPYLSRQIVDRALAGRSPLLDLRRVRAANAGQGLTTLCLHVCARGALITPAPVPEAQAMLEVGLEAYVQLCSGYQYREVLLEAFGEAQAEWNLNMGLQLRTDYADYWRTGARPIHPDGLEPRLLGVTREKFSSTWGSLLAFHFRWQPPRFYFTPREQELLEAALWGQSDEEAAQTLSLARVTVRKRWQSIYEKVALVSPELLPAGPDVSTNDANSGAQDRSVVQKKRLLLAYLRSHPEELRPISHPEDPPAS